MQFQALKTELVSPGDDLCAILDRAVPNLQERDCLAVTSKIVSLCEGRVVPKTMCKKALIRQEAEKYVEGKNTFFTIKEGMIIPAAGIDESNIPDGYLLYPKNPFHSATAIWTHLRNRHQIEHLGIIITDSRTEPFRTGVTGISIGWCGFEPVDNCIGRTDLYGRVFKITKRNLVDGIASTAVLLMGEADEQTPLVRVRDCHSLKFVSRPPTQEEIDSFRLPPHADLYGELIQKLFH